MKLHKFLVLIVLPLLTLLPFIFSAQHVYAFESDGTVEFDTINYDNGTLTVNLKNFSVPFDPLDSCDVGSQLLFSVDSSHDFMGGGDEVYNPTSCSFDLNTGTASFTFSDFPTHEGYFAFSAVSSYMTEDSQNQWDTYIDQPNGYFFSTSN
jgi:hypothetical protein